MQDRNITRISEFLLSLPIVEIPMETFIYKTAS